MKKLIFSGFGGQGVLTLGQIVATVAMNQGKEVTWIPSYGPEMRGGTANCSVIIADGPIGSPIVQTGLDILVAMNGPSVARFVSHVKPGGLVVVNSSIVTEKIERDDVTVLNIDATNIATQVGSPKVQNMVMLAGIIKATDLFTLDEVKGVLAQTIGVKKPELLQLNIAAIEKGM